MKYVLLCTLFAFAVHSSFGHESQTSRHQHSIYLEPLSLLNDVVSVRYEYAVSHDESFGGRLGIGSPDGVSGFALAAQYTYYFWGTFDHGLGLCAEAGYSSVSLDDVASTTSRSGRSVYIAPLLTYKLAAKFGFSVFAQSGPAVGIMSYSSDDYTRTDPYLGIALRLGIGWSF